MQRSWYYLNAGIVHGPFSVGEMEDRVRRSLLGKTDLVWQEKDGRGKGIAAGAVFKFPAGEALPDWLADVAVASAEPPAVLISEPAANHEDPEWLDDLRLWVGLEVYVRVKEGGLREPITLATPEKSEGLPDWLQGWLPPPAKPKPSPAKSAPPAAAPIASAVKVPPDQAAPATPVARAVQPPLVQVAPAVPIAKARPETRQPTPEEKLRDESGFDAETGQILDPVKFRRWQQARNASSPMSNASTLENFHQFRSAINAWVDDDNNHSRMLHAELHEISAHPEIQKILQDASKFGKDFHEKIQNYLAYMIENRRKYYKALAERK